MYKEIEVGKRYVSGDYCKTIRVSDGRECYVNEYEWVTVTKYDYYDVYFTDGITHTEMKVRRDLFNREFEYGKYLNIEPRQRKLSNSIHDIDEHGHHRFVCRSYDINRY